MAAGSRRGTPAGVSIVAVLAMIVGVVEVLGGIAMIVFHGDVHGYSHTDAVIFGVVTLIVGLIYLWVGRGLLKLDPTALFIGLLVSGLRLAYDVVWLVVLGLDGIGITGVVALVVNACVFLALWSGRDAFASEPRVTPQAAA